jgi:glyoxylase-like metal-dependent hydrolase (beta-lactamase superfamily II)
MSTKHPQKSNSTMPSPILIVEANFFLNVDDMTLSPFLPKQVRYHPLSFPVTLENSNTEKSITDIVFLRSPSTKDPNPLQIYEAPPIKCQSTPCHSPQSLSYLSRKKTLEMQYPAKDRKF